MSADHTEPWLTSVTTSAYVSECWHYHLTFMAAKELFRVAALVEDIKDMDLRVEQMRNVFDDAMSKTTCPTCIDFLRTEMATAQRIHGKITAKAAPPKVKDKR